MHRAGYLSRVAILLVTLLIGTVSLLLAQSSTAPPTGVPSIDPTAILVADSVTVARFFVDIDGLESGYPDRAKASGWLPRVRRAQENAELARDAVRTLREPEGTPLKIAHDSMYVAVAEGLSALGMALRSPEALRGAVPYLIGYPMGTARKVVASGLSPEAIDIDIDVTVPDQGTGYFAIIGTGRAATKGRPELVLRVHYTRADGTEWREKVRVRAKEKIVLNERWLLGVRTDLETPDASSLPDLTRKAVALLLEKRHAG